MTPNGNDPAGASLAAVPEYDCYFPSCFATAPFLQPAAIRACVGRLERRRGLRFLLHGGAAAGLLLDGRHAGSITAPASCSQPGPGPPAGGDHRAVRHPPPGAGKVPAAAFGRRPYAHLVDRYQAVDINTEEDLREAGLGGPDHLPLGRGGIGMRLLYVHGGSPLEV